MKSNKILNITIPKDNKENTLEKIKKYILKQDTFCHIVSLNPEILVIVNGNKEFKRIVETAQIKIIDGAGVVLAGRLLGVQLGERYAGVNLMTDLIKEADKMRLRVLLIGGSQNLANKLAECYRVNMLQAKFKGLTGIKDIKKPKKEEEKEIFSIVADYRPHIVFVAFGSPNQEIWIERHHAQFKNCVVMGVGGSFDYLTGKIKRAPVFLQKIGLEWFYRLFHQPWRWKRQLRLLQFIFLVIKQKIGKANN